MLILIKLSLLVGLLVAHGLRKFLMIFFRPSVVLKSLFLPCLKFFKVNLLRSLVYSSYTAGLLFIVPLYSIFFSVLVAIMLFFVGVLSPFLLLEFGLRLATLLFYGLVVGPLKYIFLASSVTRIFIRLCVLKFLRCLVLFLYYVLGALGRFYGFARFFALLRAKPPYRADYASKRYSKRYLVRLFLRGFLSRQAGTVSLTKLEEASGNTNIHDFDQFFQTGLPESILVESVQQQESFIGENSTDSQPGTFDSFHFLQFLKRSSALRLYPRSISPRGLATMYRDNTQSVFSLQGFMEADASCKLYSLHRGFYLSIPRQYESYVFVRYLVPAFSSALKHYHFLASRMFCRVSCFEFFGFPHPHRIFGVWFASLNEELADPLGLYGSRSDRVYAPEPDEFFTLDYFEEPDEGYDDVSFHDPYAAGFHFTQLVDDSSLFRRPFTYLKPRTERYWFKRVFDTRLLDFKFPFKLSSFPRFFSQAPLIFVAVLAFVREGALLIFHSFLRFVGCLFAAVDLLVPVFKVARIACREFFYRFLNFFMFPEFDGLLSSFTGVFACRLYRAREAAFIKLFFFIVHLLYTPVTFLHAVLRCVFWPFLVGFDFLRFCYCCLRDGTFFLLVENEFDSRFATCKLKKSRPKSFLVRVHDYIFR